jgi:starvation-inducible DNA-binding protein
MSGPRFRDYRLLLEQQTSQTFAMTDAVAERVRKIGGTTLRSIGHIQRPQHAVDDDAENWIDEAERRTWFPFGATRAGVEE